MAVKRQSYQVEVRTQGTVQPRTVSTLIPEVSGRIVSVSANLRAGEFFTEGEVLVEIDARQYQAEVQIEQANVTQARARLAEEKARAAQATREWKRLGESGQPDALVLRKPQLASARAAVSGAQARLTQSKLDLERARITAPYDGRVLEKNVDRGQYVNSGNVLARIYAVDYVEVRLPLSDRQLQYVEVPEVYRSQVPSARVPGPQVTLSATLGNQRHAWRGRLVRAEGAIDTRTRQLYVIAQIDDPYGHGPDGRVPLKIGQFVEAAIQGRELDSVFVIPRGILRAGDTVLVIDKESRLRSRQVEVIWADDDNAVVASGLHDGELVVTTALGEGLDGTQVLLAGNQAGRKKQRKGAGDGRPKQRKNRKQAPVQ